MDEGKNTPDEASPHLRRHGVGSYTVHNIEPGVVYTFDADGNLKAQGKIDALLALNAPAKGEG